jgi:hypothetical protein
MRKLFLLIFLIICEMSMAQENFQLKQGDMLFQDSDCGPPCEAIEKVTNGYLGANLSHIGIVEQDKDGRWIVIEAISEGVVKTPLEEFLNRSLDAEGNPKVLVGRIIEKYQSLLPEALKEAQKLIGNPYDDIYKIGNSRYYCSELIYEIFKRANNGKAVFDLQPMTFIDPETGKTFPAWIDYFDELNEPIPEGEPGLNPGGLSRSPAIRIVHYYGKPSNFKTEKY